MDRKYGFGIGFMLVVLSIGMLGGFVVFNSQGSVFGGEVTKENCLFTQTKVNGMTFSSFQEFKKSALESGISESKFEKSIQDVKFKVINGTLYDKMSSGACEAVSK